jgi:GTPase SAR1 family protein
MQIWDTAGQDTNCYGLTNQYYRGAQGCAVVYDVTRPESLTSVAGWIAHARARCEPDCVFVVIGNKTDLAARHGAEVPEGEAADFAHRLQCRHFLASALNGTGVAHAFLQLLLSVHSLAQCTEVANLTLSPSVGIRALAADADGGAGDTLRVPKKRRKKPQCCQ